MQPEGGKIDGEAVPAEGTTVPGVGLEPTRPFGQRILNPSRLPIPPSGLDSPSNGSAKCFQTATTADPLGNLRAIWQIAPSNAQISSSNPKSRQLLAPDVREAQRNELEPARRAACYPAVSGQICALPLALRETPCVARWNRGNSMIVFLYPGQGSQEPGMGAPWIEHPSWELVAEASEVAGRDVEALLLHADAEELRQTRNSQLSTFVLSMVVFDAVTRVGVEASCHAGHSLGEYTALTAAGVIDFSDAVRLVSERGDAMQAAADDAPGTMAAVLGLDDDQVDIACARVPGDVWVANYNAPGQVVVAGTADAVQEASALAKELGAKRALPLPVGGAFHTMLMAPARDRLGKAIDQVEFRDADTGVVANVDAAMHSAASDWSGLLNAQLCSPVRWRQTLHTLDEMGATTFVEVGPGAVLTGLVKRTLKGAGRVTVNSPTDVDQLLESVSNSSQQTPAPAVEGEQLFATERLVVSPATGVFTPNEAVSLGESINRGDVLGMVGDNEVRTAFSGEIQGFLALPGERVTARQPIAWLRKS